MTKRSTGSARVGTVVAVALAIAACSSGGEPEADTGEALAETTTEPSTPAAVAQPAAEGGAAAGIAQVTFEGEGVSISGEYPARLCGGAYVMGNGVSYQVQAEEWRITIASEERLSGNVALNTSDGSVNVVATANGPGVQYVRGPRNEGSLTISDDFLRAEADLELRTLLGGEPARLQATFVCAPGV